jgi:hypothetical protein
MAAMVILLIMIYTVQNPVIQESIRDHGMHGCIVVRVPSQNLELSIAIDAVVLTE